MSWIEWAVLPTYIVVPAAVAIVAHHLFRRLVPPERLSHDHEVAGYLVAVVGVLYSVVVGFLVGTVWTQFDAAQKTADAEAGYVADTYGFSGMLPSRSADPLRRILAAYAIRVHDVEFATLASGVGDPRAKQLLMTAVAMVRAMPANTPGYEPTLGAIRQAADARRLRLLQARGRLPWAMYQALILGGIMLLTFVFLFGIRSWAIQAVVTGLVAGSIGLFFGLIVQLSTPYSSAIRVNSDAWSYIIDSNGMRSMRGDR